MNTLTPEQQAINLIARSTRILILPSSPPDGDSLGSALAWYLTLKKLNKIATVVCADPIPDVLTFLPSEKDIQSSAKLNRDFIVTMDCSQAEVDHIRYQVEHDKVNIIITPKKGNFTEKQVSFQHGPVKYDLLIVVDAGDLSQLGPIYQDNPELFYEVPVINIDHHASNLGFGKINVLDVAASSTTEIVYRMLKLLNSEKNMIDDNIATLLLAGIITDTGSFQNANTTPKSLEVSAQLVNLGARQQEIIKHVYKTKNLSMLKLWGRALTKIKYSQKYRMVWSIISELDFKETDSKPDETGGIMDDLLTNTPGAEVVVLLKEKKKGLLSGSIRTTSATIRGDQIAEIFGGGGHIQAAGFKIETEDFMETAEAVIKKIKQWQGERLHIEEEVETEEEKAKDAPMTEEQRDQWFTEVGKKFLEQPTEVVEHSAQHMELETKEEALPPAIIPEQSKEIEIQATPTMPAVANFDVETGFKPVSTTKSLLVDEMLTTGKKDPDMTTVEDVFKDILP